VNMVPYTLVGVYICNTSRARMVGGACACVRARACVTRVGVRGLTWRAETARLVRGRRARG